MLVIPSVARERKELLGIVEDLQIMSRIVDKAVGRDVPTFLSELWAKGYVAGSEVIDARLAGSAAPTQGFFLEGYGALFVTHVDYPLTPPKAKSEEPEEGEAQESVWEKTKRELFGADTYLSRSALSYARPAPPPGLPRKGYDAKRVDELQKTLLEALKQATNLRRLKPDDSVTIAVLGKQERGVVGWLPGGYPVTLPVLESTLLDENRRTTAEYGALKVGVRYLEESARPGRTVLVIRAKKSDIDAFAEGELSLDEFRKKATILTY